MRRVGSIVVSQSSSAFISPRPLKRVIWMPCLASVKARVAQLLEGLGLLLRLLAELELERRQAADDLAQPRVGLADVLVDRRSEQLAGTTTLDVALVDDLDHVDRSGALRRLGLERVAVRARRRRSPSTASARRGRFALDEPVVDDEVRPPGCRSRSGGGPTSPRTRRARAGSARSAPRVSLTCSPSRASISSSPELLAHEQLLELGVLLEIALLVAHAHEVERRDRDVDVAAVEELAACAGRGT